MPYIDYARFDKRYTDEEQSQHQPLHQLVSTYDVQTGVVLNTMHPRQTEPASSQEAGEDEDGNSGKLARQALKRIKK